MSKVIKKADDSSLRELMSVFNMSEDGGSTDEELQAARREAADILQKARGEAESIRKKAHREAVERARKELRLEFETKIAAEIRTCRTAEIETLKKTLQTIISEIDDYRSKMINESREQLVSLAVGIARSVIKREVVCGDDVARLNLEEAIRLSAKRTQLIVRVSQQDLETLASVLGEIDGLKQSDSSVELVASEEILPGGCLIETSCGEVDARIETQLREIEKVLLGENGDV